VITQWVTILSLLKLGIAWEAVWELTDDDVNCIIGVNAALVQKQQDDQAQHDRTSAARG
jgi:hypothetical protein